MKTFLRLIAVSAGLFAALPLQAQWVNLHGSNVRNGSGGVLASGQFCIQPVDGNNRPIVANVAAVAQDANWSSSGTTLTLTAPPASAIRPGTPVTAIGIPAGATVVSQTGTTVVISAATTAANTGSAELVVFAGGALVTGPACTSVTNGIFGSQNAPGLSAFSAPDTALSNPLNLCLRVTVTDSSQNGKTVYTAPCVQPSSGSGASAWCTVYTTLTDCNYDLYSPLLPTQALVQQVGVMGPAGPTGPAGPAGPTGPAGAAGPTFNGGTVANPIVLPGDPTTALQASTKQYVDAHSGGGGVTTNVACTGTATTDTTNLQAALNTAGHIIVTGACVENNRLTIKSNTTLDAYGATFTYAPSSADWVLANYAGTASASRTFTTGVLTASSATLTASTGGFSSTDVGNSIACVNGDGTGSDLHTTIQSVTNSTTVVLADTAAASGSALTCSIYTRDTNITVLGGTFIMGGSLTPSTNHEIIRIKTANHVVFRDVKTQTAGQSFWSTLFEDITDFAVWGQSAKSTALFEDGFHAQGPARDGIIYGTHCNTGDDCVALSTQDQTGGTLSDTQMYGTVAGVTVDGVEGGSSASGVRLYVWSSSTKNITDVTVEHVHGSQDGRGGAQGFVNGVIISYFYSTSSATVDATIDDVGGLISGSPVAGSAVARNVLITRAGTVGTNPITGGSVNPFGMTGIPDGSVSTPSFWFWNSPGTGIYRNSVTSTMVFAVGGANIAGFNANGLYTTNMIQWAGSWGGTPGVGLGYAAGNILQVGNGTAGDRTGNVQMGSIDVAGTANASFTDMAKFECPNLGVGNYCLFRLGKAESGSNDFTMGFLNVGSGSADNRMSMAFYGASNLWNIDTKGFTSFKSSAAVASGSTITPTARAFHVTGTAAIATITAPTICTVSSTMCQITIIPDGAFTTTTGGNIAIASTAVVSRVMEMIYDPGTSKWYPSY